MGRLTFIDGDQMPILGLGTWQIKSHEAYSTVRQAIQIGYRHFDCASFYGNESHIGHAIRDAISEGEVNRDDLWITSKLWNNCHRREDVRPALETTLSDLGLEYLDLYLIHWPVSFKREITVPQSLQDLLPPGEIPLTETWSGMIECRNRGLTRHIGVSNFNESHISELINDTGISPELNQFEIHPYLAQRSLVDFCHSMQIHVTAYGSLANSVSEQKLSQYEITPLFANPVVKDIALRRGMTPAQVVLRWSIERKIAVIPKSVNTSRLRQNMDTLNFHLGAADMAALNALDAGFRCVTGVHWNKPGSPYTEAWVWGDLV